MILFEGVPDPLREPGVVRIRKHHLVALKAVQLVNPKIVVSPVPGFFIIASDKVVEDEVAGTALLEPDNVLHSEVKTVEVHSNIVCPAGKQEGVINIYA